MKPINEQISPEFVEQAKKLAQYTRILQKVLPIECHKHVQVANIRQQNLILITDSPVWTTRLRQLSPQILQFLHDNSSSYLTTNDEKIIHHIQISTRYNKPNEALHSSNKKHQKNLRISEKTSELLTQSANSIENETLRKALLRVARHANNDDGANKKKK